MAFKRESVKELRERLYMGREKFAFALSDASKMLGFRGGYSVSTIRNYEIGKTTPTINALDSLVVLAKYFGHNDLIFYEPPSVPHGKLRKLDKNMKKDKGPKLKFHNRD